ncbi:MAG: alpha-2-macroglobulin family protein, partial [Pseudobdellovibrio sp.]
ELANNQTEVIGIPLVGKGFHFNEFKSTILGGKLNYEPAKNPDYYVRALTLVTDINLTMKSSPNEVLVWATSMDKATPVKNAPVFLYTNSGVKVVGSRTDDNGIAYFKLTPEMSAKLNQKAIDSYTNYSYGFFAFVENKDDFSFVWSGDNEGLQKYRFGINLPSVDPDIIYHTVLEKNLLRPNETINAKIVYRKLEDLGLSIPKITLPKKVQIKNTLNDDKFLVSVKWDKANGTGTFSWKIPQDAVLGYYGISFPQDGDDSSTSDSGDDGGGYDNRSPQIGGFSVEEFKVPNITAQLSAKSTPWINQSSAELEFSARYFSGGPAAQLPFKVRYSLSKTGLYINDEDYSDFTWQDGQVEEGVTKYGSNRAENNQPQVNQFDLKLDQYGFQKINLSHLKYSNSPQNAVVSVEYKDANGDIQTMTRSYPLYSSPYLVGVKSESWYQTAKSFSFDAALLDLKQKPVAGKKITLNMYKVDNFSTRKKLLGGFYSYESFQEVKKVLELCSSVTDSQGKIHCHGSNESLAGEYLVAASYKDDNGTTISTKLSTYLSGGEYWYGGGDSDRMDLIPTKKSYEPNETAEFQVRGPITEGQMLVTVERKGILSQSVQPFDQKNPTIKIQIKPEWTPNIVVSAVLIRGRVDAPIKGLLDLGKPSLKMGMASIKIGIKKHILKVHVKTDKEIYTPREDIKANIEVLDQDNKPVNGEIALAAIDEGLLALRDNSTWNLLEALIQPRAHSVDTAYILSHVLGKRTLGLKAVPTGGDGAGNSARELFDTSLFWNAKIKVKNGLAQVNFKAKDSLSAFKIVAIAQAGAEQFGTGNSSIKIKKDIQIYPSLALAVRNNDNYSAKFSVRNATDKKVKLTASLKLGDAVLGEKDLSLEANQSAELAWPVQAPPFGTEQKFEMTVKQGAKIEDLLKIKQPIQSLWTERSFGASLQQNSKISIPITEPKGATHSEVELTAIPSLATELPGVKKFWDNYPFDCFEQRLSKAISLNSEKLFNDLMKISSLYADSNGLIKFYPQSRSGSVFLTNYVLQITHYKKWNLDEKLRDNALSALGKFFNGTLIDDEWFDKTYLKQMRLETLDTLNLYSKINNEQYDSLDIKLELLNNNDLAHAISILSNPDSSKKHTELLAQSLQILKSRTIATSSRLSLRDSLGSQLSWMYINDDITFSKVILNVIDKPEFKDDAGKLILSFIDLAKQGFWYNTMANAWAQVTLYRYKDLFEKEDVNGDIKWGITDKTESSAIKNKTVKKRFEFKGDNTASAEFKGQGTPWWNVLILSNPPTTQDINHGINVEKTWTPVEVKNKDVKTIGDIWKVTIKLKSKSEFQWLAVRDPLVPGAMIIDESYNSFSEKKAIEYRFYESWFGTDERIYTYQIRLNQAGTFNLPSTRAEAMY